MRYVTPHDPIRAAHRNELLSAMRERTPREGPRPAATLPSHPWKCRVEAGDKPRQWKIRMKAGFVDDREVPVAYLAEADPRGWQKPDTFPAARLHGGVCERSWREKVDPPYLLLDFNRDFLPVTDSARPPFFMTASAWERDLFMASVYLTARPVNLIAGRVLPARHRTWAGKMPSAMTAYPYGILQLARVYVLTGKEETDAQAFIQQREFYDLHTAPVEPITLLPDYQPINTSFGGIGLGLADGALAGFNIVSDAMTRQVNEALANMQATTSSVEMWSV